MIFRVCNRRGANLQISLIVRFGRTILRKSQSNISVVQTCRFSGPFFLLERPTAQKSVKYKRGANLQIIRFLFFSSSARLCKSQSNKGFLQTCRLSGPFFSPRAPDCAKVSQIKALCGTAGPLLFAKRALVKTLGRREGMERFVHARCSRLEKH